MFGLILRQGNRMVLQPERERERESQQLSEIRSFLKGFTLLGQQRQHDSEENAL